MAEIKYEVVEKYGVLSESPIGWIKEFSSINWNDRELSLTYVSGH